MTSGRALIWIRLGAAAALAGLLAGCDEEAAGPAKVDPAAYKTTGSGLKYAVLKPGAGKEALDRLAVQVHYTGWVQSTGRQFDTSRDRGEPFGFVLGRGDVIPGWDEGVKGMKEGEQRQLVIPPELGYGKSGQGPIPPDATLVFDVELVKVGE